MITVWLDGWSQWGTGTRETEVRLDGWCEGGVRQQINDGGGCVTMREIPESVESPGTYVRKRKERKEKMFTQIKNI